MPRPKSDPSVFRFKQFVVDQTGCAMKINTDGVLLGAFASGAQPKRILDIGTGTGVIALMLAQRFENAFIEAVEIDDIAAKTAERNFKNSPYAARLSVKNLAIQEYTHPELFDLIVSNPPYFINDLKNAEEKKGLARHTDAKFFEELIMKVDSILSATGSFWFVLPMKQADLVVENAKRYHLYMSKQISLHSDDSKPEFRRIVCLNRKKVVPKTEHFYLYETQKIHTLAYRRLLQDFLLRL